MTAPSGYDPIIRVLEMVETYGEKSVRMAVAHTLRKRAKKCKLKQDRTYFERKAREFER